MEKGKGKANGMEKCKEPASSSVGSLQGLGASGENEAGPPSIGGSLVSARASVSVAVTALMAVTTVRIPPAVPGLPASVLVRKAMGMPVDNRDVHHVLSHCKHLYPH